MIKQKKIIVVFSGPPIEQSSVIFEIQDGYECWDLKKLKVDEFITLLKDRIPPINENILLRHYKSETESQDIYGITGKQYEDCSWALLIPEGLDSIVDSYSETLFLLNLYSSKFLYPVFYASNFGITRHKHEINILVFFHNQNQSDIFKTKEFVIFFKTLLPQSKYCHWQMDRVKKWGLEDWRLHVAILLFDGLKEYEYSKSIFGWQRESADMATILEALFTADDTQNEEVGYRLRKRIAVLLSWKITTIEKEIKKLYSQRSAFVHGSFFAQIAKDIKKDQTDFPLPDFNFLYKQKEYVRLALVAYLHLANLISQKPAEYGDNKTVMAVLETAVIDIELRNKIIEEISKLFSLMPEVGTSVLSQ